MINTILSAITGLFSKDFLFASALPATILLAWTIGLVLLVFGVDYTFAAFDTLLASQKAGLATLAALGIVVTSYLLSALRSSFIRLWSGESRVFNVLFIGPVRILEYLQRRRYERLSKQRAGHSFWLEIRAAFQDAARENWESNARTPDGIVISWIRFRVSLGLRHDTKEKDASALLNHIILCYSLCSANRLSAVHADILKKIDRLHEIRSYKVRSAHVARDREYGSAANIRASKFGNIIQAYNYYGYRRYQLETELFWPRLIRVIPADYASQVKEPKIILDFATTMATISVTLGIVIAILGPWLWYNPALWAGIVPAHFLAAAFFYFLSVNAAVQYGDMIRSCFDLFRIDLMEALQFERPKDLDEERMRWEEISQLLAYGQTPNDLKIRARAPDGD